MEETTRLRVRIGLRLRELRGEKGWSVLEFCARSGWSRGYYYKVERGAVGLSWEGLEKMARVLRIDPVDFLVFPDADPLRHGIYDLLRRVPESTLLKTKIFVLEEIARVATTAPSVTSADGNEAVAPKVRKRKGGVR